MSKKKIISKLFSLISYKRIFKLGFNPVIVNYHSILDADYDAEVNKLPYRTEEEFEEDLIFFKENSNIITPGEFRDHVLKGKPLPKKSILFTVDDGLRVSYEILARLFKKHGISAIYFINPAFIDNKDLHYERKINLLVEEINKSDKDFENEIITVLNKRGINAECFPACLKNIDYKNKDVVEEIAQLIDIDFAKILNTEKPYITSEQIEQMIKDGFYFGGHSIDHPNYKELSLNEQIIQTRESTEYLTTKFNLKYSFFAFPYDDDFVSNNFFEKVKDSIEITFGTAGLFIDKTRNHFQRIDVERSKQSAKKELSFIVGKYYIMKLLSRNKVNRV